jgi:hypothetical protein
MVRFGVPGQNIDSLAYADSRLASVPIVQAARRPLVTDKKFPLWCEWRVSKNPSTGVEGEFWKLVRFQANGDATWVKISTATSVGTVISLSDTAGTLVSPTAGGNIQLQGTAGQINVTSDAGNNRLTFSLAGAGTAVDSFAVPNGTSPVVPDANGLITITEGAGITITGGLNTYSIALSGGGASIDSIGVDANTGPGTNPVLPTGAGLVTVTGAQVAAGTVGANVIRTDSLAANTYTIEVQQADTVAARDTTRNGVAHFNSAQFTDDQGFISIANYIPLTAFVPSVDGSVSGPPTIAVQAGNYSRVGSIYTIQFEVVWTALNGASGDIVLSGFPVTFPGTLNRNPLGACMVETIAWPAGKTQCTVVAVPGTTTARVYASGTATGISLVQMAANGTIHGSLTFAI